MRIGKTAMNKSSKQESNVLKATFEKEYGVSVEEAYKVASQCVADASGRYSKVWNFNIK